MLRKFMMLLSLMGTTVIYAEPLVVGKIENLTCPSDYYSLTRQGKQLSVKILMELHAGDTLTLTLKGDKSLNNACKVKIESETPILSVSLNGKPNEIIKYEKLPYTVPAGPAMATTTGNFWDQVTLWLTEQHNEQLKVLVGLVGKTNDPLKPQIAVLEGNEQKLVAGERALFIAWQFGKPPFTVKIEGNKQLQMYSNLLERQLQQQLKLTPGHYQLSLSDANQKNVNYKVIVVDSQPQSLLSKQSNDLTDEKAHLIAQTLCLAVQDKGTWRFEAVQRIAKSAQNDPPLQILRDALLQNTNISPLFLMEKDCTNY